MSVPRRSTAQVKVAPSGQCQPPKRIFAYAERKYVATTATEMHCNAQPADSCRPVERHDAFATVGSTKTATMMARWSWSTLPYDIARQHQSRYATATTVPARTRNRPDAATAAATTMTARSVLVNHGSGAGWCRSCSSCTGWYNADDADCETTSLVTART